MRRRKKKYYTRGTPEYNKMFARKFYYRRIKRSFLKALNIVVVFGFILALIYWVITILKSCII